MNKDTSREGFLEFLEYVEKKGLIPQATARARKASAGKVLGILDEQEAQDVTTIDFDNVMSRFANLQGQGYTPESLATYKSRVRAALDDFQRYLDNPLGFKPGNQSRERKPSAPKTKTNSVRSNTGNTIKDVPKPLGSTIEGPMSSSILPIPIRADLTIRVQGLPFDLTEAEAKKIASVIQAMAMPS